MELALNIPKDVENLQLPEPALLEYYKNLEDRVIWIDYEIDGVLLEASKQILRWNSDDSDKNIAPADRRPIKIILFTPGGDLYPTFNMIDVCAMSKTPIITINAGISYSAGLLLLLCGHKRYTMKNAYAMIHSGSGNVGGTFEQVESMTKNYKDMVSIMQKFILDRTTITTKLFNKNKTLDWYMNAEEMVKYGVVDGIIDDIDIICG